MNWIENLEARAEEKILMQTQEETKHINKKLETNNERNCALVKKAFDYYPEQKAKEERIKAQNEEALRVKAEREQENRLKSWENLTNEMIAITNKEIETTKSILED